MNSTIVQAIFLLGVSVLFYLDRNKDAKHSPALWLPSLWLWIVGSRPVSSWLAGGVASTSVADQQLDGSPTDAIVFMALLFAGIVVLLRRRGKTGVILAASVPILLYFSYSLLSLSWSAYPFIGFKRWIKDIGDLVMALLVVTEAHPIEAARRLVSRVSFVLLPASFLLIRYSALGRSYDPDGNAMLTGATTNKNSLGLITFVMAIGLLWSMGLLLREAAPNRGRRLLAQGAVLGIAVFLLVIADSATSLACFALGAVVVLASASPAISRRPARVHALVVVLMLVAGLAMWLGGQGGVASALGRDPNLTGRTDIWNAVIPLVPSRVVGAGFESFWLSVDYRALARALPHWRHPEGLNSSHNGYIEVYLNLGWVGLSLVMLLLFHAYRRACAAFGSRPEIGSLILAYVATAAVYSLTEAGFRMLTPSWIFLLFAGAAGNAVRSGVYGVVAPSEYVSNSRTGRGHVVPAPAWPGRKPQPKGTVGLRRSR